MTDFMDKTPATQTELKAPGTGDPIHIISLGAGVQSSAMALMAAAGEIVPMPVAAIFADTQDEPQEVYDWLRKLTLRLPFPVIKVTAGMLSDALINDWGFSQIPSWHPGKNGSASIGKRQCTKYFKIIPIRREIRRRWPKTKVVLWQGISLDEAHRMKPSNVKWLTHRWPLIELRKHRHDCQLYNLRIMRLDAPKSACVYCPFRSDRQWAASLASRQQSLKISKVEAMLNPRGEFLHRSLKPVSEVELETFGDAAQVEMFGNECEGMCGV